MKTLRTAISYVLTCSVVAAAPITGGAIGFYGAPILYSWHPMALYATDMVAGFILGWVAITIWDAR